MGSEGHNWHRLNAYVQHRGFWHAVDEELIVFASNEMKRRVRTRCGRTFFAKKEMRYGVFFFRKQEDQPCSCCYR